MYRKRLKDADIDSAQPKANRYTMNDGGGLVLVIYPTGRKSWRVVYRQREKEAFEKIGEYPALSLKAARELSEKKKRARAIIQQVKPETFEDAAYSWLDMWKEAKKPSIKTIKTVLNRFKYHVFPIIGKKLLVDISKNDIERLILDIVQSGKISTARYVFIYSSMVFKFALWRETCLINPFSLIILSKVFPRTKTKNRPALKKEEDLIKLAESINKLNDKKARYALILIYLMATRTNELLSAKWSEFNFIEKVWVIPPERMKNRKEHFVPLSTWAIKCLNDLKNDIEAGEYLFFPPWEYQNNLIYNALVKMGYKGVHCGHGFRTSFSSRAKKLKQGEKDEILAQLAHTEPNATTRAYIREDYFDERRELMQKWADYLVSIGLTV